MTGSSCRASSGWSTASWSNGGATAELRQAIANLEALLESEGASLADVVKTTVFLRHLGTDYDAVNEAYIDCFGDHRPARSAIGVAELPMGAPRRGGSVGPRRGRMTPCSAP